MQASPSVNVEPIATERQDDNASLIDSIERAPFGPTTGLTLGNGLQETRALDLNYRVTNIEVPGVMSLDYGYTVDSNIAGIDDLLDSAASQSFDYDPVDRLTDAQGLFGLLEYDYDASGNRTALTRDGHTEDYRIHYGNNQLLEAGPVDNTYDDNGNLTDRGGDLFTYDTQNRLVGASVDGNTALCTYNHLDQRVTKTLNGHTRLLLYDRSGNLIAEVDEATGQTLAEYLWLDGSPVAYVENGQRYQVHVDHLGTPKALTDSAGTTAWEAHHSPFGKASITSQGPTFNLRLPGQYYDAETGLHYNWRRYYDPNTGRYITSDPIGLAGGINTYAYALSNPMIYTDPTGQCPWCVGAIYGGLSGAVGGYITGGWEGAIRGGLIGAAVGTISPFGTGIMGLMANNAASSYTGQVAGNYYRINEDKESCAMNESPFENINYSAVVGASVGGAFTAGRLGNMLMRPYIPKNIIGKPVNAPGYSLAPTNALGAVGEGVGVAAGETIVPWYTNLWNRFINDLKGTE